MNAKNQNQELAKEATAQAIYSLAQEHGIDRLEIIKSIERGESYTDFKEKVLSILAKKKTS